MFEQVRDRIPNDFEDLGEQSVKNITRPVRVYRIPLLERPQVAPPPLDTPAHPEVPDKPSIAVLPFDNMSADPEQEYFSDGITEDIITSISKISGLFVIARNSVFTYKGRAVKVQEVGRDLGVRYVLEGSVRKAGDRVRVTAQLVETVTGHHLWAERYDRKIEDIFAVQDELSREIAAALEITLSDDERSLLAHQGTENMEAYDCLLRAKDLWMRFTRESNAEARAPYENALALDPNYAEAHAELALYAFRPGTTVGAIHSTSRSPNRWRTLKKPWRSMPRCPRRTSTSASSACGARTTRAPWPRSRRG